MVKNLGYMILARLMYMEMSIQEINICIYDLYGIYGAKGIYGAETIERAWRD